MNFLLSHKQEVLKKVKPHSSYTIRNISIEAKLGLKIIRLLKTDIIILKLQITKAG